MAKSVKKTKTKGRKKKVDFVEEEAEPMVIDTPTPRIEKRRKKPSVVKKAVKNYIIPGLGVVATGALLGLGGKYLSDQGYVSAEAVGQSLGQFNQSVAQNGLSVGAFLTDAAAQAGALGQEYLLRPAADAFNGLNERVNHLDTGLNRLANAAQEEFVMVADKMEVQTQQLETSIAANDLRIDQLKAQLGAQDPSSDLGALRTEIVRLETQNVASVGRMEDILKQTGSMAQRLTGLSSGIQETRDVVDRFALQVQDRQTGMENSLRAELAQAQQNLNDKVQASDAELNRARILAESELLMARADAQSATRVASAASDNVARLAAQFAAEKRQLVKVVANLQEQIMTSQIPARVTPEAIERPLDEQVVGTQRLQRQQRQLTQPRRKRIESATAKAAGGKFQRAKAKNSERPRVDFPLPVIEEVEPESRPKRKAEDQLPSGKVELDSRKIRVFKRPNLQDLAAQQGRFAANPTLMNIENFIAQHGAGLF